jgi:hypothetical protein
VATPVVDLATLRAGISAQPHVSHALLIANRDADDRIIIHRRNSLTSAESEVDVCSGALRGLLGWARVGERLRGAPKGP